MTCSVCIMLLRRMFLGQSIWYKQATDVLFPREDDFSCSPHSLVACSSSFRLELENKSEAFGKVAH